MIRQVTYYEQKAYFLPEIQIPAEIKALLYLKNHNRRNYYETKIILRSITYMKWLCPLNSGL